MSKYWFRKRRGLVSKDLGWGWMPISWEGWVVITASIALIVASGYVLGAYNESANFTQGLLFFLSILAVLILSALLSRSKTKP